MKPDFLEELEKQLVEAAESRRRKRSRFWPLRRPGRSFLIGIGGAVIVMSSAALVVLLAGADQSAEGTTGTARPTVRGAGGGAGSQLAAAPSRHLIPHLASTAAPAPPNARTAAITVQGAGAAAASDVTLATHIAVHAVPRSFQPRSFTAVSDLSWWLLGSRTCGPRNCIAIVRTTDGGRTFAEIPAPRRAAVGQLRFATTRIGYAFGHQLWTTHDGGQRWDLVPLGGRVTELSTAGGYVFAVVRHDRDSWLMRSPIGLDDWQQMRVAGGQPVTGLWTQADQVLVETEGTRLSGRRVERDVRRLAISTDNGFRFGSSVPLPDAAICQVNANLPTVWVQCAVGRRSGLWRSRDGGIGFRAAGGRAHHRALGVNPFLQLPSDATFAAASVSTAVVGFRQLYRTANGGRSYRPVSTPAGIARWQYLGFTDPTHGVALGAFRGGAPGPIGRGGRRRNRGTERLYYTTNGGRSYHRVLITG